MRKVNEILSFIAYPIFHRNGILNKIDFMPYRLVFFKLIGHFNS